MPPAPRPEAPRTLARAQAHLARVRDAARGRGRPSTTTVRGRVASLMVVTLAALMCTVGALAANGGDLRAGRNQDLAQVVQARAADNKKLADQMGEQRRSLDALQQQQVGDPARAAALERVALTAAARAVRGPAVRVVLDDAPLDVKPDGVDDDLLVVHQQDIQMVVNLFWKAGAEAMTIQGQRVMATTGIKCVGNSVVLHGVPYAPPYVIEAIGDRDALHAALDASDEVAIYRHYATAYKLGLKQESIGDVTMPPYAAQGGLKYARPLK